MLLSHGAEVNTQTRTGQTPLIMAGNSPDLDGFEVLLKSGADPLVRDMHGYTFLDYLHHISHPAWNLVQGWAAQNQPLSQDERMLSLQTCTRYLLQIIPSEMPVDPAGWELLKRDLCDLGGCFVGLESYEAARICYEQRAKRSLLSEPMPQPTCSKCKKSGFIGSVWMCKSCFFRGICNDYFQARSSGIFLFNCDADHEYLGIPGKDWKFLGKEEVNTEHETLEDWIAKQKRAHGVLPD